MVGSLIEVHLFWSMKEDEECDYDHTLIDDSSAQDGDRKIVVLEKIIQTWARMLSLRRNWCNRKFKMIHLKM